MLCAPQVVSIGCSAVSLSWDAPPRAQRYRVRWAVARDDGELPSSDVHGGWSSKLAGSVATSVSGLASGVNYVFVVQAFSAAGWGPPSPPTTARTSDHGRPDPPDPPGVRAEAFAAGAVESRARTAGVCTAALVTMPVPAQCGGGAAKEAASLELQYRVAAGSAQWTAWRGQHAAGSVVRVAPIDPLEAHEFRVRVGSAMGFSEWSEPTPPTLLALSVAQMEEPPQARPLSFDGVALSWGASGGAAAACNLALRWRVDMRSSRGEIGEIGGEWRPVAEATAPSAEVFALPCSSPPSSCQFRTVLRTSQGWAVPSRPSAPVSTPAPPALAAGAVRLALLLRTALPPHADASAARWLRELARAVNAPDGQLAVDTESAGARGCVVDIRMGARWRLPTRLATQLVQLAASPASALYHHDAITAQLDGTAGIVEVTTASDGQLIHHRLGLATDGSLQRTAAEPRLYSPAAGTVGLGGGGDDDRHRVTEGPLPTPEGGGGYWSRPRLLGILIVLVAVATLVGRRWLPAASPLKLAYFEPPASMSSALGTPHRLQPIARVVDLSDVQSIPALRRVLLSAAAGLFPGDEGEAADVAEITLVDEWRGRRRFTGRSMLADLTRAKELHVVLGNGRRDAEQMSPRGVGVVTTPLLAEGALEAYPVPEADAGELAEMVQPLRTQAW